MTNRYGMITHDIAESDGWQMKVRSKMQQKAKAVILMTATMLDFVTVGLSYVYCPN